MKLKTVRAEKVEEKNGVICLVSMFPSDLCPWNCLKRCIFCNLMLISARNLSLSKQFTYIHLKGLVTHFQKWYCSLCHDVLFRECWGLKSKNFVKFLLNQHIKYDPPRDLSRTIKVIGLKLCKILDLDSMKRLSQKKKRQLDMPFFVWLAFWQFLPFFDTFFMQFGITFDRKTL